MKQKIKLINDMELFKINYATPPGAEISPDNAFKSIEMIRIGESETPAIIIDDFYANPHDIKDFLFTLPYHHQHL